MGNVRPGGWRKRWPGAVALAAGMLLAVLYGATDDTASGTGASSTPASASRKQGARVPRLTTQPRPAGTARITGRVRDDQGPAANVRVSASRADPWSTMSERPCDSAGGDKGLTLKSGGCPFEFERTQLEAVSAREGEALVFAETLTDAEGRFTLEGLPTGSVTLWALGETGAVSQGGVPVGSDPVELTLEPGILFEGHVLQEDRETPIPDARLTFVSRWHTRFFDVATDARGAFRVGPLPQGRYSALIAAEGWSLRLKPWLSSSDELDPVMLARPHAVAGRLLSPEGKPVPGVEVLIDGATTAATSQRTTTDGQGHFQFTVPAVPHQLHAESQGAFATLDVTPPQTHVELQLKAGVFLEGTVRDDTGRPIPGARVKTFREDGGPVEAEAENATDAAGRYRLGPVSPGPHTFYVLAPRHLDLQRPAQQLQPGMGPMDFTLRRAKSVEGRVVDSSGAPLGDIPLKLGGQGLGDDDNLKESLRSDATGHFVLDVEREGEGVLGTTDPSFQDIQLPVRIPSRDVVLVLDRGASVSGTLTDARGLPVRAAPVSLFKDKVEEDGYVEDVRGGVTDDQGHFQLAGLPPGRFTLEAAVRSALVETRLTHPITLKAHEHLEVSLHLEAGRELSGVVVDGEGHPLPDARLSASTGEPTRRYLFEETAGPSGQRAGPEGRFTLRQLTAPRYKLRASLPGYSFSATRSQGGTLDTDTNAFWVEPGSGTLRLVMERDGRIKGRVVGTGGLPVTDFQLRGLGLDPTDQPDGAADFDIPFTVSGPRTLEVWANGYRPLRLDVDLTEGMDKDLGTLTLDAGWSLPLVLVDAETGAPLPPDTLETLRAYIQEPGADESWERQRLTLQEGPPTLTRLRPPPFTLELKSKGTRTFRQEVTSRLESLTVSLDPGATVRLAARGRDGNPRPVYFQLEPPKDTQGERYHQDAPQGTALLRGVEPGEYILGAWPLDQEEERTFTRQRIQVPLRGEVHFTLETGPR
jgi:hypothetical protein